MKTGLFTVTLLVTVLCAGCMRLESAAFSNYEPERILSDKPNPDEVAIIQGSFGEIPMVLSWDCWISSPGPAKRIVVDPGEISFTVTCDEFWTSSPESTRFSILAEAGHRYQTDMGWSVLRIRDETTGETVAESSD